MNVQTNKKMKEQKIKLNKIGVAGFTFIEAIVSMLILGILVGALFTCLTFVGKSARNATNEAEGNMKVVKALELIYDYPYNMITTNYFPTIYLDDSNGELVYAITTTVTEASIPTVHKKITIDYTWREGGIDRHTRYYFVKPE